MNRIVSLIASATEIVHALGLENQMVGCSHECDYPESIKKLPVCTSPKFKITSTSLEIDQQVKMLLQQSLSIYQVNIKTLDQLKPSHIITQAQCDVCAVSLKEVEQAACQIISSKPHIISLNPNSLMDIWNDIIQTGNALGAKENATKLISKLQNSMSQIADRTKDINKKPKIVCIEWIEPLMAAGNWMPELIKMAGGQNLFGRSGKHSPWLTWQDLSHGNPDIILITPCGFNIERTLSEMHVLQSQPTWKTLTAVKNNNVYIADGNQYFNRPGPRLLDSLKILAEIFFPQDFHFNYEGHGWVRYHA